MLQSLTTADVKRAEEFFRQWAANMADEQHLQLGGIPGRWHDLMGKGAEVVYWTAAQVREVRR